MRGNSYVPFMLRRGDGSTLSLDFASMGELDSRFTFTRNSIATYTNSSGIVTSVTAAATNDPSKARFDYDPTTLAARGLLIEGSATNLLSYSEDFSNAAWTKSGTNGSMSLVGTAPNNAASSRLLEENTTGYAKHSLERSITISAGIHTLSVWLKEPTSNSRRYAHIQLADGQATAARYTIVVDAQTGTITANGVNNGTAGAPTGTAHSITAYPNGWYRVTISMNHVASPSYPVIMLGDSSALFGGNNQPFYSATTPYKGLLVWGAQLEAGSGASSYIPTGASTVQRATDSCSMTGANFSSWYGAPTAFSMLFEGIAQISANYGRVLCLSSGANTASGIPNFNLGLSAATSNRPFINAYIVANNNIDTYAPAGAALTNGVPFKIGVRHQTSSHYITRGASLSAPSSYAGFAAGLANLYFGNTDGSVHRSVHYTRVKFWPVALSNAQLDSFAT